MTLDKKLLRLIDLKINYIKAVQEIGELVGKELNNKLNDDFRWIINKTIKVRSAPYLLYYMNRVEYTWD